MQLETLKNSMFALNAIEASAVVGGQLAAAKTFEHGTTFYADGSQSIDSYETD
jgi:hypothetical protein